MFIIFLKFITCLPFGTFCGAHRWFGTVLRMMPFLTQLYFIRAGDGHRETLIRPPLVGTLFRVSNTQLRQPAY